MEKPAFVRKVVNIRRNRTREQALQDCGCVLERSSLGIIATMPWGMGPEEVELFYFYAGCRTTAEIDRLLEEHGLDPDPQAQMADNEQDPLWLQRWSNACQWDSDGNVRSFITFFRSEGIDYVCANRCNDDYSGQMVVGRKKV